MDLKMKFILTSLFLVFLLNNNVMAFVESDTITNWQIYKNRRLLCKDNIHSQNDNKNSTYCEVTFDLNDVLKIKFSHCTAFNADCLITIENDKNEVIYRKHWKSEQWINTDLKVKDFYNQLKVTKFITVKLEYQRLGWHLEKENSEKENYDLVKIRIL